jgi:hypothetical protein
MPTSPPPAKPRLEEFAAVPPQQLVERFAKVIDRIERRLIDLNDSQLDTFFRPEAEVGRWSCRVLVGHVADADIVFVHRMRRAVAEENPVLAVWDENAFLDGGLYGDPDRGIRLPVAGSVAVIHTMRLWGADWLRSLEPSDFERKSLHPERGEQTVRLILTYATWHLEHHAWYLSRKLEKLLG